MKTFTLQLQDATQSQQIAGITSFVGEDFSGSFGILPEHARMMTTLVVGMARFRAGRQPWQYLAVPGGLLYFRNNTLSLSTRRYFLDDDYERISTALTQQLLVEEEKLSRMKKSLYRMEEEVLTRLWKIGKSGA